MSETRDYDLGPYICGNPHHALLHHVLGASGGGHFGMAEEPLINCEPGVALEFGVGDGNSLRCIARYLPVYGFDSFEGLPLDWRPGFPAGMFACDPPSDLPAMAHLVRGQFAETLPRYNWEGMRDIKLIHIDCDLYESAKTVLDYLPWDRICHPMGRQKAVIIFDEWHGYPGCEKFEQRAWGEFTEDNPDLDWEVIGHGVQQFAIRLK